MLMLVLSVLVLLLELVLVLVCASCHVCILLRGFADDTGSDFVMDD
jgi:hypothetical protein